MTPGASQRKRLLGSARTKAPQPLRERTRSSPRGCRDPGAALGRPLPGQPRLVPARSAPPGAQGAETTDPGGQAAAAGSSFQLLAAGFPLGSPGRRVPGAERCCLLLTAPSPSLLPSLFTTSSSSTSTDLKEKKKKDQSVIAGVLLPSSSL